MAEGPRKRCSTGGGDGQSEPPGSPSDAGKDAAAGVTLKKEIGLVSACGIIIGEEPRVGASHTCLHLAHVSIRDCTCCL